MDAVEFLKEYHRICKSVDCIKCGLYHLNNEAGSNCSEYIDAHPDKAVQIVEQWSKEHPRKTRLQDFLEKYPNAILTQDGLKMPMVCARELGYCEHCPPCKYCKPDCYSCWNEPVED